MAGAPEPTIWDLGASPEAALETALESGVDARPSSDRPHNLAGQDLREIDLDGLDLEGANLSDANLSGKHLFKAKLRGADLRRADLSGAEMSGADLRGAQLEEADASKAGFGMARLVGASLFGATLTDATFSGADLSGADLRCASLTGARFREANLSDCDFTQSDLTGSDFAHADVAGASFRNTDMRESRLRDVHNYRRADWIGVDLRGINFAGAYRLRRYVVDQNYLMEFRQSSTAAKWLYYLWWATSDCGRSVTRWGAWIVLQGLAFAGLYTLVGVDFGADATWLSPLYFSVITFTTLGYGDITPVTASGQAVAMLEVTCGYVMLGGLLSIFSNIIARRGE